MTISIAQALQRACQGIAHIDARILLQYSLGVNHAYILTHPDQALSSAQQRLFFRLVARRMDGEPVAYLIGECDFYDLIFKVTPDVLIPRPETEILVELALMRLSVNYSNRILDLGTGSGVVALTLARHCPQANVVAVDLSPAAVSIARENADNLNINNVFIATGNWFSELSGEKFDLIVSNPPYVAENDPHLNQGDLCFEPRMALTASIDGLSCIRTIIAAASDYLVAGGWLLFEHGYDQAAACRQLLEAAGFAETFSHPDLAGIMRVSGGRL